MKFRVAIPFLNKERLILIAGVISGPLLAILVLSGYSFLSKHQESIQKISSEAYAQATKYIHKQKMEEVLHTPSTDPILQPTDPKEQRIFWRDQIKKYGGEEAYRRFSEVNDSLDASTHTLAHIFGEELYEIEGMQAVKVCDAEFRFGCYHSFFGSAIHNEDISVLPQLDAYCREAYGEADTRCQHGIGHGILVYTGYDHLLDALKLCASLPSWQPTGSCSGGVFMEYNFHTMEAAESDYSRDANGDLYEPCKSLPEKFQPSCYHEQVQWWLDVFNNDFVHVGTLCKPLASKPDSWQPCYQRVGNFITEYIGADYDKIIDICSQMESDAANDLCREGSTFPMTGVAKYQETRLKMCNTLPDEPKQHCMDTLDG